MFRIRESLETVIITAVQLGDISGTEMNTLHL